MADYFTSEDFTLLKPPDTLSPKLMIATATGEHLKKATIEVFGEGGPTSDPILTWELLEVFVSAFDFSASGDVPPRSLLDVNSTGAEGWSGFGDRRGTSGEVAVEGGHRVGGHHLEVVGADGLVGAADPSVVEGDAAVGRDVGRVARELGPGKNLVINLSGRGDKDVDTAVRWFDIDTSGTPSSAATTERTCS